MNVLSNFKQAVVVLLLMAAISGFEPVQAQEKAPDTTVATTVAKPADTKDASTSAKQDTATQTVAAQTNPAQVKTSDTPPETDPATQVVVAPAATTPDDSLQNAIKQMQAQLAAQAKQIEALQAQYSREVAARQKEIDKQDKQIGNQTKQIATQKEAIQSLQQQVDQSLAETGETVSKAEKTLRSRLETVESSIKSSQVADSTMYDVEEFPGSLAIPGTSAAIKIGGFVKMNVVESFDPIGTTDRFIVGSIPVPQESAPTISALTVSQSRLNFDLRDSTKYGPVRAFIEGDFAGDSDTFRLRHAFGQYKSFLIGKTWTTFMDSRSRPEDLDFEGINGQVMLRQPQIRYFPKIGQSWHLLVSAEDPTAVIENGQGLSQMPDLIASVEKTWFDDWHIKSSLLLRKMSGDCDCLDGESDSTRGWALSISGMTNVTRWDSRDNAQIQLTYGQGHSRYINDLGSIGAADAVFDESTGKLTAVESFAMYIAFQKWWTSNMRSNFNYGFVSVKNIPFASPTAYRETNRLIANIIWSPIARIDLGAQILSGSRINEDKERGTALQIQLSAKYRF